MAVSLAGKSIKALKLERFPAPFSLLASLLALFIIVQAVRIFWTLATPVAPVGDWQPAKPTAMSAETRAALFGSFDPFFRTSSAPQEGSEVITSLAITLFGIRSNEASGGGSAIVSDPDGVQQSIAVGQEIMPGVTLHSVAFDHIVISNNGALEKLYLDQSLPAENVTPQTPPASTTPTPEVSAQPAAQLNPQNLARGIGFSPRNDNGKITGLVVSAKDDGSMLKAAGLQAGDIIVSVNGNPVTSPSDLASQFRPNARISVEIERGAQKVPVAIILE